jgi:hypothetical protein
MELIRRAALTLGCSLAILAGAAHSRAVAGTLTTIYTFPHGVLPMTGVVPGPGGALYGATNSTIYELTQDARGAWHLTTVFNAGAAAIVGSSSALYAATNTGNTVFELTPPAKGATRWTGMILHRFTGGKDGAQPLGIALAPDGSVVGTTQLGGGAAACGSMNGVPTGCGTLFRIAKTDGKWVETIVHAFQAGADGAVPTDSPAFDPGGNLYVSTSEGGSAKPVADGRSPDDAAGGCGTIVVINHWEKFQADVKDFLASCSYTARLLFDPNGPDLFSKQNGPPPRAFPLAATETATQLLFTATGGGYQSKFCLNTSFGGCGSIALLAQPANGSVPWDLRIVHDFTGADGFNPYGALTQAGAGRAYGVASSDVGTCPAMGCGEVFTVAETPAGRWGFAVVYRFTTDAFPVPQLMPYKGRLLGTTTGYTSRGTVYELTP